MSKIALRIISLIMIILGIIALVPTWEWFGTVAEWAGIVEIAIGIVGFAIAYSDHA
jgi:hypothetical protein